MTISNANMAGVGVWERLWGETPASTADEAHLARERRNPRWAWVRSTLVEHFGRLKGLRCLELGSGRGDLSALLAAEGAEVTLLDYSPRALEQARRRFARLKLPARFVEGDLLRVETLPQGRFDVAGSLGVVEHFRGRERRRALAAHQRALVRGGVVVVSVPYAWGVPYRLWKMYLELRRWWPYGMEIPYRRGELRRLAASVGLKERRLRVTGFWQSVGDHWARGVFGRRVDWVERESWLDRWCGGTLTMLATADRPGGSTAP